MGEQAPHRIRLDAGGTRSDRTAHSPTRNRARSVEEGKGSSIETNMQETPGDEKPYVFGTHEAELERLGLQHRVWWRELVPKARHVSSR